MSQFLSVIFIRSVAHMYQFKPTKILSSGLITLVLFSLLQTSVMADETTRGLEAMRNQQYEVAVDIWTALVAQGNVGAQYNLALSLQQSATGAAQSRGWLQSAARDRLVTAYNRFQPGAIKPGAHTRAIIIPSPDDWVREQNPRYYTLQLASSTNPRLIEKYYREHQLEGQAGYYRNVRKGKNWYALVYGAYPSSKAAQEAIATLPDGLKKWQPWVRRIKDIQRTMQPLEP